MNDRQSGKARGPASYFSSIESKYGYPIEHWIKIATRLDGETHAARVAHLKTEHGMGHGHANAIVAYTLAQGTT